MTSALQRGGYKADKGADKLLEWDSDGRGSKLRKFCGRPRMETPPSSCSQVSEFQSSALKSSTYIHHRDLRPSVHCNLQDPMVIGLQPRYLNSYLNLIIMIYTQLCTITMNHFIIMYLLNKVLGIYLVFDQKRHRGRSLSHCLADKNPVLSLFLPINWCPTFRKGQSANLKGSKSCHRQVPTGPK